MSTTRVTFLESLDELRAAAPLWDDLWQRSDVTLPSARAELLAQWIERFAPHAALRVLVVEEEGRWLAGIPLLATKVGVILPTGRMPVNDWSYGGGLLLDMAADSPTVLGPLIDALRGLPWQLLHLDPVPLESPAWQAMQGAICRRGVSHSVHPRYRVARIEIDHDWEAFQRRWEKTHRQRMTRMTRRLAEEGQLSFVVHEPRTAAEVEPLLCQGWEIEDRSWKGRAGSSVLRRGMYPFFLAQARQLAAWGQLRLAFLMLDGRPLAFSYNLYGKGVVHAMKIGYDPEYARFSPGQLLHYHYFADLFRDPGCRAFDFLGEMSQSSGKWRSGTYPIGEVFLAPRRLMGRLTVHVHRRWWPYLRPVKARLSARLSTLGRKSPETSHGTMS